MGNINKKAQLHNSIHEVCDSFGKAFVTIYLQANYLTNFQTALQLFVLLMYRSFASGRLLGAFLHQGSKN